MRDRAIAWLAMLVDWTCRGLQPLLRLTPPLIVRANRRFGHLLGGSALQTCLARKGGDMRSRIQLLEGFRRSGVADVYAAGEVAVSPGIKVFGISCAVALGGFLVGFFPYRSVHPSFWVPSM